jgi:hypothetical protein
MARNETGKGVANAPPPAPQSGQSVLQWCQRFSRWVNQNKIIAGRGLEVATGPTGRILNVTDTRPAFWGKLTWDNANNEWDFVELYPADDSLDNWGVISTGDGGREGQAIEANDVSGPADGYVLYTQIHEYLVRNAADTGQTLVYVFEYPFNGCIPAKI